MKRCLRGWASHVAIAAAVFVVARDDRDRPRVILEGAHSEGDGDSVGTLAGALLVARLGVEAVTAALDPWHPVEGGAVSATAIVARG